MSPPLLGAEGEGKSNGSIVGVHHILENESGLKDHNYLSLPNCSEESNFSADNKINLNLKATELRLGLPGSQSPEREPDHCIRSSGNLDEKPLFPLLPSNGICSSSQKMAVLGNKRWFADTVDVNTEIKTFVFSEGTWIFNDDAKSTQAVGKFPGHSGINMISSPRPSGAKPSTINEKAPKELQDHPCVTNGTSHSQMTASNTTRPRPSGAKPSTINEIAPKELQDHPRVTNGTSHSQMTASNTTRSVPSAKAQVVGWPPLRTFRKNSVATSSKNSDEVGGKQGPGALFVKVSMDGAPFLRKVDLKHYTAYEELSSALEKMFSCFTISKCGSHEAAPGRLSESKLRDLLHGSEYVLTYEDKDGDWMLVGDVPWVMFIDSCKRLKIMKSSDSIGLAPRAVGKSRNLN